MKLSALIKKPALVIFSMASIILIAYYFDFSFYGIISIIIIITGFYLWIKAIIDLGESFSILPKAKKLVTKGTYKKIRHPIYIAQVFILLGLFILVRNYFLILFIVGAIIVLFIRVKKEEKILKQKFRDKYNSYKKQSWF